MSDLPDIAWTVIGDTSTTIVLEGSPLARIIPDGVVLEVRARASEPRRYGDESAPPRTAGVGVGTCTDGGAFSRGRNDKGATRFAGTRAAGSTWADVTESHGYRSTYTGDPWPTHVTAWRADGIGLDLPPAAMQAWRAVASSATAFALQHHAGMWPAADVARALARVDSALADVAKAREAVQAARAAVKVARAAARRGLRVVDLEPAS